jgi:hypothetical protein
MNPFSKFYHEVKVRLGLETVSFNSGTAPKGTLSSDGKKTFTPGTPPSKVYLPVAPIERYRKWRISHKKVRVLIVKGFNINLILILALLAFRHFCPDAAKSIQPAYDFLDGVILPVVNWFYKLGLKCAKALLEIGWVKAFIAWLGNLAA